jgi:hypothetical protein
MLMNCVIAKASKNYLDHTVIETMPIDIDDPKIGGRVILQFSSSEYHEGWRVVSIGSKCTSEQMMSALKLSRHHRMAIAYMEERAISPA